MSLRRSTARCPSTVCGGSLTTAETITERNIERVKALGGGIAVQHRMAFQGEYFVDRYGRKAAEDAPPIRKMLAMGVPVGAGTDATRVASHNPFVSLYWLVTGKTVGGTALYPEANRLERMDALRLYTVGSSWFSGEESKKGAIVPGQLADLAVLSADYFAIPEEEIKRLESVLTLVGGKVVYATAEFSKLAPPSLTGQPGLVTGCQVRWVHTCYCGAPPQPLPHACAALGRRAVLGARKRNGGFKSRWEAGDSGCDCFAF